MTSRWQRAVRSQWLRQCTLGVWLVLLSSACARLSDISGPTPIGGVVNSVAITTPDVTLNVGSTATLQVSARDADGQEIRDRTVTWSSSDANIVDVSPSGVLTALSTGVAQISASIAGRSATAQVTVVQRPVSSIEVGPLAPRILVGGFIQLVALPRDDTGAELQNRPVFWSSSDATIANVDAAGFVTGVSPGAATITATSESREAAIGVVVSAVPVVSVVVSPRTDTIVVGQSTQLSAIGRDSLTVPLADRGVSWTSSASNVATVSASGLVIGVAPGTVRVDAAIEGVTGSATIVVQPRPIGAVVISPGQSTLTVGETTQLSAQITDANGNLLTGRRVTYVSANPVIAQVNAEGTLQGVSPGVTTIRASSEGRVGEMRVTVLPTPVASVRITPAVSTLSVGGTVSLAAVALDAAGNVLPERPVIWSSGAPTVLSVNSTGRVVALSPGTGLVFATIDGRLASARVTVPATDVGSVQLTPSIATIIVGTSADFVAVARDADNNPLDRPITWTSSNTAVAVVSSAGRVRALSLGIATITASADGATASAVITVAPTPVASVTVGVVSAALVVGQTTQATVTLRDADNNVLTGRTVSWGSSDASVATVSGTGLVTAVGGGVATITASSGPASGSVTINVSQQAGSLEVQRQPAGAVSGSAFATQPVVRILDVQGNVVTTGPGASTVVTATRASGIATLSGTVSATAVNGVATFTDLGFSGLGVGAHTIRFTSANPALTTVSAALNVAAGPAATLSASSSVSQSARVASAVSESPSVRVTDAGGNAVSGVNVTFSVTAGGGTISPASPATVTTAGNGVAALNSWTLGVVPGANAVRAVSAGLAGSPVTFNATATVGSPTQLAITQQPAGSTSGVVLGTQPVVEIRDAVGNRVIGATSAVTATVASGNGELVGTRTVNAVDGVATFSNLQINGSGAHTLRFSVSGLTAAVSNSLTVTQVAASLVLREQPAGARSGIALGTQPVVEVRDNAGLPVVSGSGASLAITAAIATGGASLSGTTTVNAVNGVAAFTNLTLTGTGTRTLRFSSASPSLSVVSESVLIGAGAAANIAATSALSQSATVSSAVSAPPSVRVTDGSGNNVSGVNVTFTVTAGGGAIVPASVATVTTNAQGIAALTSWTLGATPGANSVTAAVAGLSGSPVTFSATGTVGSATQLVITTQPSGAVSGVPFTAQPRIELRDASNNLVSSSTAAVTVSRQTGTGTLAGTLTVNAVGGVVTFTNLQINGSGDHALSFAAAGLTGAVSAPISVSQVAASLAIVTQPAGAVSGAAFSTQPVVHVLDNAGLRVQTGSGAALQVTASRETGTGTLSGTTQRSAVNGVITFTDLALTGSGAHTLRFAAASPALSVISSSFTLGAGAPSTIAAVSDTDQSAAAGSQVDPPAVVVTDGAGNPVSGVNVTFAVTAGGGTTNPASGAAVVTGADGRASLQSWTLGVSAGLNTVTATAAGLSGSPVTFNATATALPATQLAIVTQPDGAVSGIPFVTQPVIAVRDANNQLVASSTAAVTVELIAGSGTLVGALTVNAVNGVATFTDLQINGSGTRRLRFSSPGLTAVTSNNLSITQRPRSLVIEQQPAGAVNGVAFVTQPIVRILDDAGLLIESGDGSSLTVTATKETGTGTLGGETSEVATGGRAVFTDLSLTGSGAYTLRFATSSPALSVISASFTVGAGAAANIASASATDQSALAGSQVTAPRVLVTDGSGNPVSGVDVTFAITAGGGVTDPVSGSVVTTGANGIAALTSWTLGSAEGINTVTATASGLSGSPVTFNATATAQPATQLAVLTQPSGAVSGLAFTAQPSIAVRNAGNTTVTSSTAAVTAELLSGTGALVGTQTVNAVSGIATFTNLRLDGVGDHQLRFTAAGLTSVTSNTFTVTQVANALAVERQPAGAVSGIAFSTQPIVRILDNAGLLIESGAAASLTVTAAVETGAGTLGGTAAISASNGRALFTDLNLTGSGAHTLQFSTASPALSVISGSISVGAAPAANISARTSVSQSAPVSTAVAEAPSVLVTDGSANPVSGVNVTFAVTAGGGTTNPASGSVVVTDANGIASLTSWTLGAAAGTNTVTATATGLSGSPVSFDATATEPVATQLAIVTQPAGAVSGVPFTTQPVIEVRNASNGLVASSTAAITVDITSGGGVLLGTQTVNAVAGVATFTNLQLNGVGDHQLRFTSPGLSDVASSTLTVTQVAGSLSITQQPAGAVSGAAFTTQPVVRILDNAGLLIESGAASSLNVTAAVATGSGTLGGTVTIGADNGVAEFANLSLTGSGAHTIGFSTTSPALSVISSSISVEAAPATQLAVTAQPASAVSGVVFASPVTVQVRDAGGSVVTGASNQVTASIASGDGALAGTFQVDAVNGVATFANLRIDGPGDHTLQFTATGLTSATTATIAVTQAAASLSVQTQPTTVVSGAAFTPQPVIEIRDNAGLRVTTGSDATRSITVAKASGGATLSGTTSATAVAGLASFTDLSFTDVGTGSHTLEFSIEALGLSITSGAITVNAGAAATLSANSALTQSATVSTAVSAPPSVRVTDGAGNPVAGVKVVFAVGTGDAVLSPASGDTTLTNASGVATLGSWTLGAAEGDYTVSASAAGLSGSPIVFTATATPAELPGFASQLTSVVPAGVRSGVALRQRPGVRASVSAGVGAIER